jgi:hypothetical protein
MRAHVVVPPKVGKALRLEYAGVANVRYIEPCKSRRENELSCKDGEQNALRHATKKTT